MAFLRTLLAAVAAFVFSGTGQGRNIAAFDPVNIGSNISHSHPMQHSRSLLTVITMTNDSADSVCNNTATDGDEDRRNALGPVDIEIKEHRMTLLSILILCIGHILVWASSFTHSWSYSPSPVKNRPTKAFRKRFPGWKRRRWYPIALFLSSMCVPAQASQYSTIAVSIASRGDTGAASSNAVGVALTAAATAIGSGGGGTDEAECTIEWCEEELNKIKTDDNEHVIEYIIEVILPQVKDARFIPVFIGLCPTPEMRGHESLGGKGRRDCNRKTALSIRLMKALSRCLPTREQGGIDSGNSDLPNGFWVNARETCTNNGETCKVCRSWRQYEANAIGQALCILSKCVKYYEGCIVAINVSGVSVNADYIFDYLREHGSFDGLCEYGTHISKLGCKCKAWSKSHQCNVASRTLAAIDDLLAPIYHKVNIEPPASFLRTGLENSLFKYVTPDGNVGSCSEKCAECCTADATKVDMLLLESLEVNDSSFNEGQEEEDDD